MPSQKQLNVHNPTVKRIMNEIKELTQTGGLNKEFFATPITDDIYEIHFTIRGPPDTPFSEGLYHGSLRLPANYPLKPPEIVFLNENGRFAVHKKICLSITNYHPESWQPSWNIRTMLVALSSLLSSPPQGMIGGVNYSNNEIIRLAAKSKTFHCSQCNTNHSLFLSNKELWKNLEKRDSGKGDEVNEMIKFIKVSEEDENENNNKRGTKRNNKEQSQNEEKEDHKVNRKNKIGGGEEEEEEEREEKNELQTIHNNKIDKSLEELKKKEDGEDSDSDTTIMGNDLKMKEENEKEFKDDDTMAELRKQLSSRILSSSSSSSSSSISSSSQSSLQSSISSSESSSSESTSSESSSPSLISILNKVPPSILIVLALLLIMIGVWIGRRL